MQEPMMRGLTSYAAADMPKPPVAITQEQQQFAEVVGNVLADYWLRNHPATQRAATEAEVSQRCADDLMDAAGGS